VLREQIATGGIGTLLREESAQWREFVEIVERLEESEAEEFLEAMII
jgi:hypothetical protein